MFEDRGAADFSESGEIVEDRFADEAAAEIGVEGVGEAVGFVAGALEETEAGIAGGEVERVAFVGEDDGFFFFGEADEGRRFEVEDKEGFEGGVDLTFAAVDDDEIGERAVFFGESAVTAANHFFHGAEIVVADEAFDFEAAVVVFVGTAVGEVDHGGDDEGAGDVGDVETLDGFRRAGKI